MGFKWFDSAEFECPCCGANGLKIPFGDKLDKVREDAGIPLVINSGFRCEQYNAKVGGSKTSTHLKGLAVDISCTNNASRFKILDAALKNGIVRVGIANSFIHLDMDPHKAPFVVWLYPDDAKSIANFY